MYRRRVARLTLLLTAVLGAGMGLWLRTAQHQYALNCQLIDALVNAGADPNTRYDPPSPVPSLPELVKQMLHRSPPPLNESGTALSMACGGPPWRHHGPDVETPQLVQAMLTHGAKVNSTSKLDMSPLMWAVNSNRLKTARLLLEHGANINAQDFEGSTVLIQAIMDQCTPDLVDLLLNHGASVNVQDVRSVTASIPAFIR